MRPVLTWKYTEVDPTLISDGPRSWTLCRFAPWQVMQAVLNSCRPASMSAWLVVVSFAPEDAANSVYAPPTPPSATISTSAPDNRRRHAGRRLRGRGVGSAGLSTSAPVADTAGP